jgi:predicted nucleic acid-binding protein
VTLRSEERVVIDASVAVKCIVPEPDSARAEVLLGLLAPDPFFAGCANVLRTKARRREMTVEKAEIAAQTLEQRELAVVSTTGYLAVATSIAVELNYPAYDAVCLAVAEAPVLRLVTADDRLVRKVEEGRNRFRRRLVTLSEIA